MLLLSTCHPKSATVWNSGWHSLPPRVMLVFFWDHIGTTIPFIHVLESWFLFQIGDILAPHPKSSLLLSLVLISSYKMSNQTDCSRLPRHLYGFKNRLGEFKYLDINPQVVFGMCWMRCFPRSLHTSWQIFEIENGITSLPWKKWKSQAESGW